jgi:predicted  nucleic acid-binding Zn-ribbon protein
MAEQDISKIMTSLARIEEKLGHITAQGDDHEERLRALENKPGKRWDTAAAAGLTALIAGIVGMLLGKFTL